MDFLIQPILDFTRPVLDSPRITTIPWTSINLPTPLFLTTLLALSLPLLIYTIHYIKMTELRPPPQPFPFLSLPAELRNMVYEELLSDCDPRYPVHDPVVRNRSLELALYYLYMTLHRLPIRRFLSRHPDLLASSEPADRAGSKPSTWIFLANRQVYGEFMDFLTKRKTFHFTVSKDNFPEELSLGTSTVPITPTTATNIILNPPSTPTTPTSSSPSPSPKTSPIFPISPQTLSHLHHISITLITTSNMLGVSDPRLMIPGSWPLAMHLKTSLLSSIPQNSNLSLNVKAIGDPLWSPLWVWYHAFRAFRGMGEEEGGPRFGKMMFTLDTWSPGENYLLRTTMDADSAVSDDTRDVEEWCWYCPLNHLVTADGDEDMTVRQFCGKLYAACEICERMKQSTDTSTTA